MQTSATYKEIMQQPAIWRAWQAEFTPQLSALKAWITTQNPDEIWLWGAGTSAYIEDLIAAATPATMTDLLRQTIADNRAGHPAALPSVCSAHPMVLEASMRLAGAFNRPLIVEASSNQVSQFGGYTGMQPIDFVRFVCGIADECGFSTPNPAYWQSHYHGDAATLKRLRHTGPADRIRYYWVQPEAQHAVETLMNSPTDPALASRFSPETVTRAEGQPLPRAYVLANIQQALAPYFFEEATHG